MDSTRQQQYRRDVSRSSQEGAIRSSCSTPGTSPPPGHREASPAVATSGAAVASALGYEDGESVPLNILAGLVSRMTAAVSVPVSIDLEAGYGDTPEADEESVIGDYAGRRDRDQYRRRPLRRKTATRQSRTSCGEDHRQCRDAARKLGIHLFINARTDPFMLELGSPDECLNEAANRARAYADAGADGIFVPGLNDLSLIRSSLNARRCRSTSW